MSLEEIKSLEEVLEEVKTKKYEEVETEAIKTEQPRFWSPKGRLLKVNPNPTAKKYYRHEWYEKNKDKAKAYMSRIINCTCGLEIKYSNLNKHVLTSKHEYFYKKLNNLL
jgi:hypothetical protein